MKGFVQLIGETNDYAGQRELIAEYLEAEVCTVMYVQMYGVRVVRGRHTETAV